MSTKTPAEHGALGWEPPPDPIGPGDRSPPADPLAPRNPLPPSDPRPPLNPDPPPGWLAFDKRKRERASSSSPPRHAATSAVRADDASSPGEGSARKRLAWPLALLATTAALVALHVGHGNHAATGQPAPTVFGARPSDPKIRTATRSTSRTGRRPPIAGVTLPGTGGGLLPLHPLRLLLRFDNRADLRRADLPRLGAWLTSHERRGTAVRVLVAHEGLSAPEPPAALTAAPLLASAGTRQAAHWLSVNGRHSARHPVRLAIAIGATAPRLRVRGVRNDSVALRAGAPVPSTSVADPRRADAIAAVLAMQVIQATRQSEKDPPHLRHVDSDQGASRH